MQNVALPFVGPNTKCPHARWLGLDLASPPLLQYRRSLYGRRSTLAEDVEAPRRSLYGRRSLYARRSVLSNDDGMAVRRSLYGRRSALETGSSHRSLQQQQPLYRRSLQQSYRRSLYARRRQTQSTIQHYRSLVSVEDEDAEEPLQVARYGRRLSQYRRSLSQSSRRLQQYSRRLSQATRGLQQYGRKLASRSLSQYSRRLSQATRSLQQYGRRLSQYGAVRRLSAYGRRLSEQMWTLQGAWQDARRRVGM